MENSKIAWTDHTLDTTGTMIFVAHAPARPVVALVSHLGGAMSYRIGYYAVVLVDAICLWMLIAQGVPLADLLEFCLIAAPCTILAWLGLGASRHTKEKRN